MRYRLDSQIGLPAELLALIKMANSAWNDVAIGHSTVLRLRQRQEKNWLPGPGRHFNEASKESNEPEKPSHR